VGVGEQAEDVAAHRAGLAGLDFGPQAVGVPEVAGLDQQAGRAQQPAVGVAAAGAEPRGPQQVAGGDGVVVALGFHAGGQVGLLRQGVVGPVGGRHPVRERRVALQHPARHPVQPLPGARCQVVVHRGAVERVVEPGRDLPVADRGRDEPGGQQAVQRHCRLRGLRHRAGHAQRHPLAQDRQRRRQLPGRPGQLRQPGRRRRRQRPRHRQRPLPRLQLPRGQLAEQRPDVQREAAGVPPEPLRRRGRQHHPVQAGHLGHLHRRQRADRDPQAPVPVEAQPLPPVGRGRVKAAGHDYQHPVFAQPPGRGQQREPGLRVRPVQVLHRDQHRPAIRPARPLPDQLKAGRERGRRVAHSQLRHHIERHPGRQLIRLRPYHPEIRRQRRDRRPQQRRLARPGLPLDPHHPRTPGRSLPRPGHDRRKLSPTPNQAARSSHPDRPPPIPR
jgi:hypothetical protein